MVIDTSRDLLPGNISEKAQSDKEYGLWLQKYGSREI
jgi:hypothetical protein